MFQWTRWIRTPAARAARIDIAGVDAAVRELTFPAAIFNTCPWQRRDIIDTGLRQWLRCCGAALRDGRTIGMPSHAVDEAWHGFILCTEMYAEFCGRAYGRFLHHYPEGVGKPTENMADQLGRTVVAWSLVTYPNEKCVLWDLDSTLGLENPWGIPETRVADIQRRLAENHGTRL